MRTRVFCCVHKTGSTRSGFSHTALMMAMECVKVAGCVALKGRGSEVARLLKIVNTCVGRYIHMSFLSGNPRFSSGGGKKAPAGESETRWHRCEKRFPEAPVFLAAGCSPTIPLRGSARNAV